MTHIEPLAPGLYARSEALVEASRDHDRGRITDDALAAARRTDLEGFVGAQAAAGYTRVSTGQLDWHDIFRPLTQLVDGLTAPTLTRFLDTNTFYRRPALAERISLREDALPAFLDAHAPTLAAIPTVVTLPSPTAFVSAGAAEDGTFPRTQLASTVAARVLVPLVQALHARGPTTVVLTDPWLARHPDPAALVEALEPLDRARADGAKVLLQLPFTDAAPLVPHLARVPLDGVIADLTLTELSALKGLSSRLAVGLGVVDVRTSLVETPERLAAVAARAADYLAADTLFLAPTGDLQHVPEAIARQKVRALGDAARIAGRKGGGR